MSGNWLVGLLIRTILLTLPLFVAFPAVYAAEVFQVRNSSLLQIGDRNRTYTVKLSCLAIDPIHEDDAVSWLRHELPRRRRVNLQPQGSDKGILVARVTPLGASTDLSQGLIAAGFGRPGCPTSEIYPDDSE